MVVLLLLANDVLALTASPHPAFFHLPIAVQWPSLLRPLSSAMSELPPMVQVRRYRRGGGRGGRTAGVGWGSCENVAPVVRRAEAMVTTRLPV